MKHIDSILEEIEKCIKNNWFIKIENEHIELKSFNHADNVKWDSVMQTICAFLNTDNGIIILGILEIDKPEKKGYEVNGFNFQHENSLKEALKTCTNDNNNPINIDRNIKKVTKDFLDKKILVIYIEALPIDEKFVFYKGNAYKRDLTADIKISLEDINKQKEEKQEYINARELQQVNNTTIEDLNIDKVNQYIYKINEEFEVINPLKSNEEAISFYKDNYFIRDNKPTLLGMLVCGNKLTHFLNFRSQVDCYVELQNELPQNKKIINDNIIPLLQESERFILRNIQTGLSVENSGSKTFEYPLELIREVTNNAIAHRDYTLDKYININIVPFKHIEIRNPGRFKNQLLILLDNKNDIPLRRIITNNANANNPRLAKVLNFFQKWEGRGRGMKNIISACLDGHINLPYFIFHSPDDLSLFLPKGQLVDDEMQAVLDSYSKYINQKLNGKSFTLEMKKVFAYFYKSEIENKNERWTLLLTKNNNHLNSIATLADAGLIYEHPQNDIYHKIYVVDRVFYKNNFKDELIKMVGSAFLSLSLELQSILHAIYLHKNYSDKDKISANLIGNYLYYKNNHSNFDLKKFEIFKRKIRNQFNKLESMKYIISIKKNTTKNTVRIIDYILNENFNQDKIDNNFQKELF